MPYIKPERRKEIVLQVGYARWAEPFEPGDLNYVITKIIMDYLKSKGKSYANMSAIRGVLADVSTEFYRRVMAPYEDKKMKLNGDVY